MPTGRVVTFPDFIPAGQEHLYPGMGNGGRGCDYIPEGKNCFDEWVGEPAAIAPPRRGPGRPRKDKYSRKPVKVAAVSEAASPMDVMGLMTDVLIGRIEPEAEAEE